MNVLLISANTETINMPTLPMGLGLVAAAARQAGHSVRFLDLMAEPSLEAALGAAIAETRPDAIGISIRNIDDQASAGARFLLSATREVVTRCKALSRAPVILGGAGYSMFPESALHYLRADMGIQGEGEAPFTALLAQIAAGADPLDVPGLYLHGKGCRTPRAYEPRLDRWPFPAPDLFDVSRFQGPNDFLPFQTRRGCPLRCSYCATAAIEGNRIRMRPVETVVAELARWRVAGFRRVFFVDNTFNLPPGYARRLCERMASARLDITWRAILYPGRIDADLVRAMAAAGCTEVSLGFESGSDKVLAGFGKRFDTAELLRASALLADAGIRRMGFLLLGGPDETRETAAESLDFAERLQLEAMKLTVGVRIYPYTRMAAIARAEGVIDAAEDLLFPRFYIRAGLEDWLRGTVAQWTAQRPYWFT